MSDALDTGFDCVDCGEEIDQIMALIEHSTGSECAQIIPAEALSPGERSTLLYVESCLVDNRGELALERMNYEDTQNIKLFAAAGLLDTEVSTKANGTHVSRVTKFTDAAWDLAAECRKLRGQNNVHEVPEVE